MNESLIVKNTIQNRRTYKVIADISSQVEDLDSSRNQIDDLISAAGNAPVHYACDRIHLNEFSSPVPWRAYKLDHKLCRSLKQILLDSCDTTKIPNMLTAAHTLIQVTWLPDAGTIKNANAGKEEIAFDGTLRNMEHIAAASAFIQSLLIVADSAGYKTYWSSGGPLKGDAVFEKLGISRNELLLGSVFLFPQDTGSASVMPGSMAQKRGEMQNWSKWVG